MLVFLVPQNSGGSIKGEVLRLAKVGRGASEKRHLFMDEHRLVPGNLILVRQISGRSMVYSVPEEPGWSHMYDTVTLMDEADHRCLVSVSILLGVASCAFATLLADDASKVGPIEFKHAHIEENKLFLGDVELIHGDKLLVQWPDKNVTLHDFHFVSLRLGRNAGPRYWIEVDHYGQIIKVPLGTTDSPKLFLLPRE